MVRIRILRPLNSWSERKSIAHTWFGAAGGERSSRSVNTTDDGRGLNDRHRDGSEGGCRLRCKVNGHVLAVK